MVFTHIKFDQNPYGTFFAGQVVSGKVTIQADKPKIVKSVVLKINGYAETKWIESQNASGMDDDNRGSRCSKKCARSVTYQGRENYLSSITYLMGSQDSDTVTIAPGFHSFNFACLLPATCPSSFEGNKGKVRYYVRVTFVIPWKLDLSTTLGFTVLKVADLNFDSPVLKVPTQAEIIKDLCCGPCRSKPFILTAKLPKTGFVSGEDIPVTVVMNNPRKIPIKVVKISLNLFATYVSQYPKIHTCVEKFSLVEAKLNSFNEETQSSIIQKLRVPPTPSTCQTSCKLIQLVYEIHIDTKIGGMHGSPSVAIPVTIGNVPMTSSQNQEQPILQSLPITIDLDESEKEMSSLQIVDPVVNRIDSYLDSSIAPPTYEESTFLESRANVNDDDENATGKGDFCPRYPVYILPSCEDTIPKEAVTPSGTTPKKTTWL